MTHKEFEKIVMNKLLAGEDRILLLLKKQYLDSKVLSRQFTGCGFFTEFTVPESMQYDNTINGRIDDVKAKILNHNDEYLFFILYIENGKIDTLECFTTMDIWYDDYNVDVEYYYL